MGSPSAASIASVPVPLLLSGAASVQTMMARALMSAISRLWSGPVSPFPILSMVFGAWHSVAVSVCFVMLCWCGWRWYFVRAVHDYMMVFFTFMTSDMRAVSCAVFWFLALKNWSSSFDIMLTVEARRMVVVSCCTALSFSTLVWYRNSLYGVFLCLWVFFVDSSY